MGNMDENAEIKLVEKGFITDSNEDQKITPAGQGGCYEKFKPTNVNQEQKRIPAEKKENVDVFECKPALGRFWNGDVNRIMWHNYLLGIKSINKEINEFRKIKNPWTVNISIKDKEAKRFAEIKNIIKQREEKRRLKNHLEPEIPRPIMLGFPEIAQNQEWQVDKYFLGDHARKSVRPTKDWDELQYIACSNGVHHVIGNGKIVLVCSIQIKK